MKVISHSEITTYLDCQKKWDLVYNKKIRISSPHLTFGDMGHKVLLTREIPDELLYPELKDCFGIKNWHKYFGVILSEIDELLKDYDVLYREEPVQNEELKGFIDIVLRHKETKRYLLVDYKFSTGTKKFEELFVDEQLYIYAYLFSEKYNISLEDIDIGYLNISKSDIDYPRVLANGKLSKDKNQNTTYELYMEKINELGLNIEDYLDVLEVFKNKKQTSLYSNSLNLDVLVRVLSNVDNVIKDMQKGYILEKCSYQCTRCEFYERCKRRDGDL